MNHEREANPTKHAVTANLAYAGFKIDGGFTIGEKGVGNYYATTYGHWGSGELKHESHLHFSEDVSLSVAPFDHQL